MIDVQWAGEGWVALAERALWWPRRRTLCIADLHLGKAAAFRHGGVPVPESTTSADLLRLTALLRRWAPDRLVILGDMLHARTGMAPSTLGAFSTWRSEHRALDVLLIRGNHDASAGHPPADWNLRIHDGPHADVGDGSMHLCHDPAAACDVADPVLCGHLHPAVVLMGTAHGLRAPCFWFQERIVTLPAFGSFTGSKAVRPGRADRILVVRGSEIADVSHS